jgi:hypothetical protein
VVDCYEQGDATSSCVKCGEFLDLLKDFASREGLCSMGSISQLVVKTISDKGKVDRRSGHEGPDGE